MFSSSTPPSPQWRSLLGSRRTSCLRRRRMSTSQARTSTLSFVCSSWGSNCCSTAASPTSPQRTLGGTTSASCLSACRSALVSGTWLRPHSHTQSGHSLSASSRRGSAACKLACLGTSFPPASCSFASIWALVQRPAGAHAIHLPSNRCVASAGTLSASERPRWSRSCSASTASTVSALLPVSGLESVQRAASARLLTTLRWTASRWLGESGACVQTRGRALEATPPRSSCHMNMETERILSASTLPVPGPS
mmetsp:Transcript_42401/g.98201  ORF Transcript_42401/g.98201 Transcript_42401/m.98201 type:complete len:252 (-) Transcript_42401:103-858(-)